MSADKARELSVQKGFNYDWAKSQGYTDEEIIYFLEQRGDLHPEQAQNPEQQGQQQGQESQQDGIAKQVGQRYLKEKYGTKTPTTTSQTPTTTSSPNSGGSNFLTSNWGWGVAAAIEAARDPVYEDVERHKSKGEADAANIGMRAGQGAAIGGQYFGPWGYAIGAAIGADTGFYEKKKDKNLTQNSDDAGSTIEKDAPKELLSGGTLGTGAFIDDELDKEWQRGIVNPLREYVWKKIFK